MGVTVPSAGDSITASWGSDVATRINNMSLTLSANVTTSSGTFSDLTGLTFACTSGKNYTIEVILTYDSSSTSGGPVVGFNHPGGTCHMLIIYSGETSATSQDVEAISATDTGTGVATANTAGANYFIRAWVRYQCTSNGTFALRIKRNTAGTQTFHKGSGMRVVSD